MASNIWKVYSALYSHTGCRLRSFRKSFGRSAERDTTNRVILHCVREDLRGDRHFNSLIYFIASLKTLLPKSISEQLWSEITGYVSVIICREGTYYANQNEAHDRHNSVNMHDAKEDERMVHSPLDRLSGRSIRQRKLWRVLGRKYYVHMHCSLCHFL